MGSVVFSSHLSQQRTKREHFCYIFSPLTRRGGGGSRYPRLMLNYSIFYRNKVFQDFKLQTNKIIDCKSLLKPLTFSHADICFRVVCLLDQRGS